MGFAGMELMDVVFCLDSIMMLGLSFISGKHFQARTGNLRPTP